MRNVLKTKTFWGNLVMAILPAVSNHPKEHMLTFTSVWMVVAIILRLVTKDKVVLIG